MRRLVTATVVAACLGLTACVSSPQAVTGGASSSSAPARDVRLVGTWKLAEVRDGAERIHADARTFEYLVFTSGGAVTAYEGDGTDEQGWTTVGGRLVLRTPDGESFDSVELDSETAARIAMALSELESSRRIDYRVSAARLTLSGVSRLKRGSFADPTSTPTSATSKAVRATYVRVHAVPAQGPTAGPLPRTAPPSTHAPARSRK